jgi:transcriptional regulator with XRE-family HTH domain
MSTRERPIDRGRRLAAQDRIRIGREIRAARLALGRSVDSVGRHAGISSSHVSRIELGDSQGVPLESFVRLGASVALDVRLRAYPGADVALDAGQLRLIGRLRKRLPAHVQVVTEVPLPIEADQRAWDAVLRGLDGGPDLPIDADTRLVDVQAQARRITLKLRDSGIGHVVWLLADSVHNRAIVRAASLPADFPVSPRAALAALAAGRHPGGSAVILL